MDRFHVPPPDWGEGRVVLRGDEGHHCLRVMRKKLGAQVEIFDGVGRRALGVLVAVQGSEAVVDLQEEVRAEALRPAMSLCVAIPKGKTMELIVQKAVELGVATIQPLVTERTVVRLDGREAEKKREKWQRIALETCKQCGQDHLPVVAMPLEMGAWLEQRSAGGMALMASLADGARGFRALLREREGPTPPARIEFLVGPEGDFTEEETALAIAAGFQPVGLGEIVLRVETAALFGLSALRYEFGPSGHDHGPGVSGVSWQSQAG